jgi:hypothetical protein
LIELDPVVVVVVLPAPRIGAFLYSAYLAYLWAIKRADERTRTADLLITSELLYQLSYVGLLRAQSISQGCTAFTRIGLTQR